MYAPSCDDPKPIAAVCNKLASVQFSESTPWLLIVSVVSAVSLQMRALEEFSQSA